MRDRHVVCLSDLRHYLCLQRKFLQQNLPGPGVRTMLRKTKVGTFIVLVLLHVDVPIVRFEKLTCTMRQVELGRDSSRD